MPRSAAVLTSIVATVLAAGGVAVADGGRAAAQQLFEQAGRTHDEATFVACGKAFLDVYNHDPGAAGNDEVLYDGAVCFERGHSLGVALQTYQLIARMYPRSPLARLALLASARAYLAIASYDQAAPMFEDYARRYAGEQDARDALANAIVLRGALGDDAKRAEDVRDYVRMWGAKKPDDAADQELALIAPSAAPAEQARALRTWLKTYGGKVGPERTAVIYARLGDALWRQSCPTVPIDGLCVVVVHAAAGSCGAGRGAKRLEVITRNSRLRTQALAAYDRVIRIVDQAGLADPALVHVAAMARIARTDDGLEQMIALRFPASATTASRVRAWKASELKASDALERAYSDILTLKDAQAAIAAAARLGQVAAQLPAELLADGVPSQVRSGPGAKAKHDAYCGELGPSLEPLRTRAAGAFAMCVTKAAELGVYDAWVGLCRREGQALDPAQFPALPSLPPLVLPLVPAVEPPVASGAPALAAGLAAFAAGERAGWTAKTCRATAATFTAIAKQTRSADAQYMAGLSLHRCGLAGDARAAYEQALALAPGHAAARSNLGELAWRAGDHAAATQAWNDALHADGKLYAAHVDLAIAGLETLRTLPRADPARRQTASEADFQARSALALGRGTLPFVVLAMLAVEGDRTHALELAIAMIDQAMQLDDHDGLLWAARAVLAARQHDWTRALMAADRAATLAPTSEPVMELAGLVDIQLGRYDEGLARLAHVTSSPPEVVQARAIASHALHP